MHLYSIKTAQISSRESTARIFNKQSIQPFFNGEKRSLRTHRVTEAADRPSLNRKRRERKIRETRSRQEREKKKCASRKKRHAAYGKERKKTWRKKKKVYTRTRYFLRRGNRSACLAAAAHARDWDVKLARGENCVSATHNCVWTRCCGLFFFFFTSTRGYCENPRFWCRIYREIIRFEKNVYLLFFYIDEEIITCFVEFWPKREEFFGCSGVWDFWSTCLYDTCCVIKI